ncbi:MAG: hypothetical protein V1762_03955 [Nitrospirota bacterium]
MSYYGWIPILSGDVSLEAMKSLSVSGCYSDETIFTDYIKPIKCRRKTYYDRDKRIIKINIEIPELCILTVNIDTLDSGGLVKFDYAIELGREDDILHEFYAQIAYNSIKDFYHLHIHHDSKDDYILRPVIADEPKIAVQKILNQYRRKIILYHKQISNTVRDSVLKRGISKLVLKIFKDMFCISDYICGIQQINIALGEFTYALSFIDCCINDDKEKSELREIFSNAAESLKIIRERIAWRLGFFVTFIALCIATLSLIANIAKIFVNFR